VCAAVERLEAGLREAGVPEPELSSRYLVSQAVGGRRVGDYLSGGAQRRLSEAEAGELSRLANCRLARMPLQYIAGNWDFRGITLLTRPPVFIPRPETEQLVDLALEHIPDHKDVRVLEIGPGCGNICLSLLHEKENVSVTAVDRSRMAVELTRLNALRLGLDLRIKLLHLRVEEDTNLGGEEEMFDLLVSNPPYVLRKDLQRAAPEILLYEDLRALDGGPDGLDVILPILNLADKVLCPGGRVLLEVDPCHPHLLPAHLERHGGRLSLERTVKDFRDKDRFVVIVKAL